MKKINLVQKKIDTKDKTNNIYTKKLEDGVEEL